MSKIVPEIEDTHATEATLNIHAAASEVVVAVIEHSDMSEIVDLELDGVGDLRMSPEAEQERGGAPPPRRKSFSKLRRRLSQTFRFSFNGSLSEFSHSFAVNDDRDRSNGEIAIRKTVEK